MATQYSYQACDAEGKIYQGQVSADSEQEAVALLQARHLIPVQLSEARGAGELQLFQRRAMSNRDLIEFTNGLCTLVQTHVPIDRALNLLEGLTERASARSLIAELRREIKEGKSLAEALQSHPAVFSHMYVNMVHAGEEGGILDKLLPRLERFLEQAEEARRTVLSALIYPAILGLVGVLSVALLLVFVVPRFAGLFADMGPAIPPSAALLLGLSTWLKQFGWSLLLLPPLLWLGWRQLDANPQRRLLRDAYLLRMPLLGGLLLQADSSRFCRTLGALLGAGIPLLKSLHIVHGVIGNQVLRDSVAQVEEAVRGGVSLGGALQSDGHFPLLLSQLVMVGEESGRTASVLDKLAESFDTQVKQQTTRLLALLEPVLILTLGLVVGAIVIVMLSAVFSINDVNF